MLDVNGFMFTTRETYISDLDIYNLNIKMFQPCIIVRTNINEFEIKKILIDRSV